MQALGCAALPRPGQASPSKALAAHLHSHAIVVITTSALCMQAIATGVVSLTADTRNFGSTFRGFREAP